MKFKGILYTVTFNPHAAAGKFGFNLHTNAGVLTTRNFVSFDAAQTAAHEAICTMKAN